MAIDIFGRRDRASSSDTQGVDPHSASPTLSTDNNDYYDAERQDEKGRKFSRVAAPGAVTRESDQLDVGKQIELEQGNSIKYRTCSWQKVSWGFFLKFLSNTVNEVRLVLLAKGQ